MAASIVLGYFTRTEQRSKTAVASFKSCCL
ncbi:hypothetical protein COLO4_35771 [Corchorus olitorius]|uniref:Uncharacterized protein n=1 Tax=Corchorus olitorius TaxID=93759 RepID=A0A1R3GDD4_9ROSI|nr:hypothetical protein COLO4_35771 [Corchorus olitorius]